MEAASDPLAVRASTVGGPKTKSAVTNGRRLHVVRPGDTAWARRFRDVLAEILSDVHSNSSTGLSEGQRQLARRAATIAIACEKMEGEAAAGTNIDLVVFGMLVDRLGRVFHRLGLKRQARDVGPTLGDILRADLELQRQQQQNSNKQQQQQVEPAP